MTTNDPIRLAKRRVTLIHPQAFCVHGWAIEGGPGYRVMPNVLQPPITPPCATEDEAWLAAEKHVAQQQRERYTPKAQP